MRFASGFAFLAGMAVLAACNETTTGATAGAPDAGAKSQADLRLVANPPQMPADGQSRTRIRVLGKNFSGLPLGSDPSQDTVTCSTTRSHFIPGSGDIKVLAGGDKPFSVEVVMNAENGGSVELLATTSRETVYVDCATMWSSARAKIEMVRSDGRPTPDAGGGAGAGGGPVTGGGGTGTAGGAPSDAGTTGPGVEPGQTVLGKSQAFTPGSRPNVKCEANSAIILQAGSGSGPAIAAGKGGGRILPEIRPNLDATPTGFTAYLDGWSGDGSRDVSIKIQTSAPLRNQPLPITVNETGAAEPVIFLNGFNDRFAGDIWEGWAYVDVLGLSGDGLATRVNEVNLIFYLDRYKTNGGVKIFSGHQYGCFNVRTQ
ncbi:MAG: hypothetical protein GMKNLPBB_00790 [Myxococcota bacterium]|nr:hypothetical protein [Myxococcota bacterium]